MSRFVTQAEIPHDSFDWGEVGWRCRPDVTGAKQLTVMDVTLAAGAGHAFHKHPDQEEMIIVKAGRIEQWLEQEKQELGPGDAVYIDADVVHASFTLGDEPAQLQVVLAPSKGAIGYEVVDVFEEEPWEVAAPMKAAVVREFGAVDVGDYPDPEPGPNEVVVELRAAALNRRDTYVVDGIQRHPLPFVPGSDGAGVRRDTGAEVVILPSVAWGHAEDAPGPDFRILGGLDDGTWAELIKVPRANVYPKPARLSWEEAAAFPLAGLTAYRALFARGRLRGGETVLVLGAGSGVSTFAVQLACRGGARVLVTSSSEEKIARAKELGAADGTLYTEPGWVDRVRELGGGAGVDLVIDSVGSTLPDSLACLRPGGRCVVFGSTGGTTTELQVRPFFLGQLSLLGTTMGSPRDFEGLLRAFDGAGLTPAIDSVRPLEEANAALERQKSADHFGKVVLTV